jgi:hypothetical protein
MEWSTFDDIFRIWRSFDAMRPIFPFLYNQNQIEKIISKDPNKNLPLSSRIESPCEEPKNTAK